jgi:hypothetical protein
MEGFFQQNYVKNDQQSPAVVPKDMIKTLSAPMLKKKFILLGKTKILLILKVFIDNLLKPIQYRMLYDIFTILFHTAEMKHELGIVFIFHEKLYDLNLFLQRYNLAQTIEYISDSNFKLFEQFNIPIKYSTISQTYLTKNTSLFLCKGKKIINSLEYSNKIP